MRREPPRHRRHESLEITEGKHVSDGIWLCYSRPNTYAPGKILQAVLSRQRGSRGKRQGGSILWLWSPAIKACTSSQ